MFSYSALLFLRLIILPYLFSFALSFTPLAITICILWHWWHHCHRSDRGQWQVCIQTGVGSDVWLVQSEPPGGKSAKNCGYDDWLKGNLSTFCLLSSSTTTLCQLSQELPILRPEMILTYLFYPKEGPAETMLPVATLEVQPSAEAAGHLVYCHHTIWHYVHPSVGCGSSTEQDSLKLPQTPLSSERLIRTDPPSTHDLHWSRTS